MKLILASNNAKKLAELRALLAGLSLDIVSQTALGIAEADEPHHSFVENALAKATMRRWPVAVPPSPTTRACAWARWAGRRA